MRTRQSVQQKIEPDDGESHSDFMDRCQDEGYDAEECQIAWEDRSAKGLRFKTHAEKSGQEFVLSDETPDRMDDIIIAEGWDLANFKKIRLRCSGISRASRSAHGKISASRTRGCSASWSWPRKAHRIASTR